MKDLKRIFSLLLVIAMLASMCITMLAGCDDKGEKPTEAPTSPENTTNKPDDPTPPTPSGENAEYTVSVKTRGGMALDKIGVFIQDGNAIAGYAKTDADGNAKVTLPKKNGYTAVVKDTLPDGYTAEESYVFNSLNHSEVIVTSSVILDKAHPSSYKLGDVMHDFTITTYNDKREIKLSDILKEKDMVLLNFWYDGCTYCLTEFPEMENVYRRYKDNVEILALSPYDDNKEIADFMSRYAERFPEGGLTFPAAHDSDNIIPKFNIGGFPTSVVVDRYGVICLIVEGAMSEYQFEAIFDNFTGKNYEQRLITDPTVLTPIAKPNVSMPSSDEIAAVLNGTPDMQVTYSPETSEDDAEYAWPFIIGKKGDFDCIKTSNAFKHSTFAIIYAEVELKQGQALAFDYWASSERGNDVLHVIVDGESIYQISGDGDKWETLYPYVAVEDGVYKLALCYIKDSGNDIGDDTIYIKNLRIVSESSINKETYIFRQAATDFNDLGTGYNKYAEVTLGADGYYHVGSADGPVLLANLMGYTHFSDNMSVWMMAYNGLVSIDGVDYADRIEQYANYSIHSKVYGYCSVNEELKNILEAVCQAVGTEIDNENEWLQMCAYYEAYGTDGVQMTDPIKGLAWFSAFEAKLDVANEVEYTQVIMPRGYLYRFVPETSGVYRITSYSTKAGLESGLSFETDGWILDKNRNEIYTYGHNEKLWEDASNVSMIMYMEAGKDYYIDIAYNDVEAVGKFSFRVERTGDIADIFTLASAPFFTMPDKGDGVIDYNAKPVAGGVDVMLVDGKYYVKNRDGSQGSILYADFCTTTGLFDHTILEYIKVGGFNFKKTSLDMDIEKNLAVFAEEGTDEVTGFKNLWGEYIYEQRVGLITDVKNGIFHGKGDYTDRIKVFADNLIMNNEAEELNGCIEVTEELAEILQIFMDTFVFDGVEHSWTKLCFYYKHYGPTVSAE